MIDQSPIWLELGASALSTALDELWHGDPLSEALRKHIESKPGSFLAYVPGGVSEDRALLIRAGGLLPTGESHYVEGGILVAVNSLIEIRDDLFARALQDDPTLVCLIPDFNPRPDDPHPVQGPGAFWVGDRCFHWINGAMGRQALIDSFCEAELPWNGFAVLARLPTGHSKAQLQSAVGLELLAQAAMQVSFRAYDGESFWIWSPIEP